MNNQKPINKSFIIISFIAYFLMLGMGGMEKPTYLEAPYTLFFGIGVVLVAPLFALWIKALWNEIIPRITSWRKITFIEALGLMMLFHLIT